MKNYRNQNSCYNCKSIFIRYEHDEGETYFCTKDSPQRPLCMSVSMHECIDTLNERMWQNAYRDWDNWAEERGVKSYGICDDWKIKND